MKSTCRFIFTFMIILCLTVNLVSCFAIPKLDSESTPSWETHNQDEPKPTVGGFVFDPTEYPPTEGSDSPEVIELFGVRVDGKYYNSLTLSKYSIRLCGYDSNGEYLWSSEGERGFPMRENMNFPKGCPVVLTKSAKDVEIIGDCTEFVYIDKETDKWYRNKYPEEPGLYWLSVEDGKEYSPTLDPDFVPPETYPTTIITQYQYVFLIVITG